MYSYIHVFTWWKGNKSNAAWRDLVLCVFWAPRSLCHHKPWKYAHQNAANQLNFTAWVWLSFLRFLTSASSCKLHKWNQTKNFPNEEFVSSLITFLLFFHWQMRFWMEWIGSSFGNQCSNSQVFCQFVFFALERLENFSSRHEWCFPPLFFLAKRIEWWVVTFFGLLCRKGGRVEIYTLRVGSWSCSACALAHLAS